MIRRRPRTSGETDGCTAGTLARQEEAGSIFFVGRRKQIIRRSGENISAAEVESVLSFIEHVLQAAVVPVPDDIREEEVFACVVADTAAGSATREAAEELLRQAAKRSVVFQTAWLRRFRMHSLPTTATQKLRYGAIIELAQGLLAARGPQLFDVRDVKRSYRAQS